MYGVGIEDIFHTNATMIRSSGDLPGSSLLALHSEFVVSIMSDWFIESANHTCGDFPPDVDEMEAAGLTPAKSTVVAPPRVKESAVNMECKVFHISLPLPL